MSTSPLCTHGATSFTRATVFYDHGRQSTRVHRCIKCNVLYFARVNNLTAQQQAAILGLLYAFSGQEFTVVSSGSQEIKAGDA